MQTIKTNTTAFYIKEAQQLQELHDQIIKTSDTQELDSELMRLQEYIEFTKDLIELNIL